MPQTPINIVHTGPVTAGTPFSLPNPVAVGSVVMVIFRWSNTIVGGGATSSIDGAMAQIGTDIVVSGETVLERFYSKNSAGGVCTITSAPTGANFFATAFEIPNCDTTAPLVVSAQASGSSTTPSSGATAARGVTNSVGIGSCGCDGGVTFTAGSSFTLIDANGDVAEQAEYQIFAASGTDAATFTIAPSAGWGCAMDVFKAASAGGGTWGAQLADRHNRIVQGA